MKSLIRTYALLAFVGVFTTVLRGQRPELVVQTGHFGQVAAVAFGPDGKLLASAGSDTTITLWDTDTRRQLRSLTAHTQRVSSVVFGANGTLFSGSYDGTVRIWDTATGELRNTIRAHELAIDSVALSPDGKILATGSLDHTIKLWNVSTGLELRTLTGHSAEVTSVAFSPSGDYLVSGSCDHDVKLWEVGGMRVKTFSGHSAAVLGVAFSADGRQIASSGGGRFVKVWDVKSGEARHTFESHAEWVSSVAFSPDDRWLIAGTNTGGHALRLWDLTTGREVGTLATQAHEIYGIAFSRDGKLFASGGSDNAITLREPQTWTEVGTLQGHVHAINAVALSQDDRQLVSAGSGGDMKLWDLSARIGLLKLSGHTSGVTALAFSPAGNLLATSNDYTVKLWDVSSSSEIRTLSGHGAGVRCIAFSPDGTLLASGADDNSVILWNVATGQLIRTLSGHIDSVLAVAFSPTNEKLLASASGDMTIRLWNIADGQLVRSLEGHDNWVQAVAFSPKGDVLASGSVDKTVRLWRVSSGRELRRLEGHTGAVESVVFLQGGAKLVSGGGNHTIRLWDVDSGRELRTLEGHSDVVTALAISETMLWSGSKDTQIRLWDVTKGGPSLARLTALDGGDWVVSDPGGRFDTNYLDEIRSLSWVFPDQPLKALPPEIFMRDYYEPKLLPRLLACHKAEESDPRACTKEFKPIRPLASLNRVQPLVEVKAEWADEENGIAKVMVKVSRNSDPTMRNGKTATKPYDVRLFRGGQLVRWAPTTSVEWQLEPPPSGPDAAKNEELDLQRWQEKTEIKDLGPDGTKELPPFLVQVPRRADLKQVTFTAYAFNEDRVKSATASATLEVKRALTPRVGKAYLISVGVNRTESSPNWDLHYAANDARRISEVVGDKLEGTKQFSRVVRIELISDQEGKEQPREAAATKVHVQAVLDVLAGRRKVEEQLKKEIPHIDEVEKAQPEDVVMLAFSSHGYTDDRGVFHMVLADIGPNTSQDEVTPELQQNSLSSDMLSGWLREVDVGEIVMVVDSCHSAATVEAEGFKPGPMGSRGLGQLAYDKGMRILAASKAKESAVEREGVEHGLLSYALVEEGLVKGLADFQPKDGKILMGEWLAYGEQEVPKLFQEGDAKGVIQVKGGPDTAKEIYHGGKKTLERYQQPVLFDFAKSSQQMVLANQ